MIIKTSGLSLSMRAQARYVCVKVCMDHDDHSSQGVFNMFWTAILWSALVRG